MKLIKLEHPMVEGDSANGYLVKSSNSGES
jgi:hypothetical protein